MPATAVRATYSATALQAPAIDWRNELETGRAELQAAFYARPSAKRLLTDHTRLVDRVLRGLWIELGAPAGAALLAVGGYGRGELFPFSDIDVLVLIPDAVSTAVTSVIERFVGMLWDSGLEIGHSVRTIDECETEMARRRDDTHEPARAPSPRRVAKPLTQRFRNRLFATLDVRAVLRGEDARAAAAAPALSGHGVQPRAQRQGESRAACATCRRSSGSRAQRASARPGASSPSAV